MGAWILFFIFCIPAVIAWVRDLSSRTAITILSLLNAFLLEITSIFGLFFGIILLLWSIIGRPVQKPQPTEIKKLVEDNVSLSEALKETKAKPITEESDATISEPSMPEVKSSVTDELVKLAELKDKGLLSDEEFESAKKKILSN